MRRRSLLFVGLSVAAGAGFALLLAKGLAAQARTKIIPTPVPRDVSLLVNLPKPTLSGRMPLKIDVPDVSPEEARPFFDRFSWQSFIALNWPADPNRRGEPLDPDNPDVFKHPLKGCHYGLGLLQRGFPSFSAKGTKPSNPVGLVRNPEPCVRRSIRRPRQDADHGQ